MHETFVYFRGFLGGVLMGLLLAMGLLVGLLWWILDFDKRLTPLSQSQRSKQGVISSATETGNEPLNPADEGTTKDLYEPPEIGRPEDWPQEVRELLMRELTPNVAEDFKVSPISGTQVPSGQTPSTLAKPNSQEDRVYMGPTLDVEWVNLLVSRFFVMLRESEVYKRKTATKVSSKMNAKLKNNSFMVGLHLYSNGMK